MPQISGNAKWMDDIARKIGISKRQNEAPSVDRIHDYEENDEYLYS